MGNLPLIVGRTLVQFFYFNHISLTKVQLLSYHIRVDIFRYDSHVSIRLGKCKFGIVHDGIIVIHFAKASCPSRKVGFSKISDTRLSLNQVQIACMFEIDLVFLEGYLSSWCWYTCLCQTLSAHDRIPRCASSRVWCDPQGGNTFRCKYLVGLEMASKHDRFLNSKFPRIEIQRR